jgi:pimeloyl-ACP methyl ester carboxylesterase
MHSGNSTPTPSARLGTAAMQEAAQFYERSALVRSLRWAMRHLQDRWPSLTQRVGQRLFLTPMPLKWQQRRGQWQGAPSQWLIEHWPFERASLTVYRTPQYARQPSVLLIPGWGGTAEQMQPLADALRARGWAAVIVEPPAHGRSRGINSSPAQFARALHYVQARLALAGHEPQALVAHSLGAHAAAYAVARGLGVQRLVLISVPDTMRNYFSLFAHLFGLREPMRARIQQRVEAQEAVVLEHLDAAYIGPRVQTPTLLVHDRQDSVHPFDNSERFAAYLPQAQLWPTEGLGHRHILKDAAVHGQVLRFLEAA